MKKAIMIIICAIYIASIAVVNFFGLEVAIFQGFTYVDQIEITNLTVINGGDTYEISPHGEIKVVNGVEEISYRFNYTSYNTADENAINPNMVKINYALRPDNADNKNVDFVYDVDAYEGLVIFHEDIQTVEFITEKTQKFTVTISTTDGHNLKKRISILCIKQKN